MTSEKAYNKIDNLCCLNAGRYQQDLFQDYDGKDEDLCKDVYEMIDCLEVIKKNLDNLKDIELKTHLLYGKRKAIAKEYIDWCNKNNVVLTDPTNMITWFLGFKLKEWIIRGKQ